MTVSPTATTTYTLTVTNADGRVARRTATVTVQELTSVTITQSASQAITADNSVACHSTGIHANNSYYRAFTLSDHGITNAFYITNVEVGIERAIGNGGTQPMTLNLYAAPSGTVFPDAYPASFTLVGTEAVTVADQSATVLNIPITGTVPADSVLVVEVFTPDGQTAGNSLFVGSNAAGETAPTYIMAADCSVTAPTTTADIGFPGMAMVLNVTGDTQVDTTVRKPLAGAVKVPPAVAATPRPSPAPGVKAITTRR